MASIRDVIQRWERLLHGARCSGPGRPLSQLNGSNVFGEGDTLYSYGRHFPLCKYLRPNRRRGRALYLLNGDRFSVSTTRHQNETRSVVARAARVWDADTIVIPFSALAAAGIERASIVPLEIRPDEWLTVAERPISVDLHDTASATESVITTRERWNRNGREDVPVTEYRWLFEGYRVYRRVDIGPDAIAGNAYCDQWPEGEPHEIGPDWDRFVRREHRLGDSLFLADTLETRAARRTATVREIVDSARWGSLERDIADDGTVGVARTVRRRARYVSSFDSNEPAPLYFLATLPRASRARTVDDAILDLAPPAVHAAILRGRHVDRQGDIFAIETTMRDEDLAGFARGRLTQWDRGARARPGEIGYVAPLTADERRRVVARARVLWRKRWNAAPREPVPSTPRGSRSTRRAGIAHAERIVAHRRASSRAAILRGDGRASANHRSHRDTYLRSLAAWHAGNAHRDRYRNLSSIHGGTYALELWEQCKRDAYHELRPAARPARIDRARAQLRDTLSIHGTAHTATEVARGPGGAVYIRGVMRHVPALEPGRRGGRDHVNRKLREGIWYLAVRNTVPRQRGNGRRR